MQPAGSPSVPVYATEFGAENEVYAAVLEGTVLDLGEVRFKFCQPARMGKVAGGEEFDTLHPCGIRDGGQCQVLAAGVGEAGMNVEICDRLPSAVHGASLPRGIGGS